MTKLKWNSGGALLAVVLLSACAGTAPDQSTIELRAEAQPCPVLGGCGYFARLLSETGVAPVYEWEFGQAASGVLSLRAGRIPVPLDSGSYVLQGEVRHYSDALAGSEREVIAAYDCESGIVASDGAGVTLATITFTADACAIALIPPA